MKTKTPELNKMQKISDFSQKIGEFIEWLSNEKEITLTRCRPVEDMDDYFRNAANRSESFDYGDLDEIFLPIQTTKEKLLAEFFEIDLVKVEKERQALLAEIHN